MASKGGSVSKTARIVALGIAAKGDLEIAARLLDESRGALERWADELTIEPENAHQSAVGVQAEAIRVVMTGLTVRAAAERLAVVAQLATDAAESKGGASCGVELTRRGLELFTSMRLGRFQLVLPARLWRLLPGSCQ